MSDVLYKNYKGEDVVLSKLSDKQLVKLHRYLMRYVKSLKGDDAKFKIYKEMLQQAKLMVKEEISRRKVVIKNIT